MKKVKKKLLISFSILLPLVTLFLLINGKEINYSELKMREKNPTSFVFNASLKNVQRIILQYKTSIDSALGQGIKDNQNVISNVPYLKCVWDDSSDLFKIEYIRTPENKNDFAYTHYVNESEIFISENGFGLDYCADFHIHLEKMDDSLTFVKINTLKSEIYVPIITILSHAPGFGNTYNVEPSTIEEYKILLVIGEKLGIKNKMPKLLLPEKLKK